MTLNQIRQCNTFEELRPAIEYLCQVMHDLSWGEFVAFQHTIETQALKVGSNLKDLNDYAEHYQQYGKEWTL